MDPLVFHGSRPFTIGVELEFQLLDPASLDLIPRGPQLLAKVPEALGSRIKSEFIQSMAEINTAVCKDMAAVEQDLTDTCRVLETLGRAVGCVPFAASLHPFALIKDRHVSAGERYAEIMGDLQEVGRRMITQALHVHIGMTDAESTVRVCDRIRPFLPILLALTASSPFLEGRDTGFASYRTSLFKTLPRSGIPETLGSWQHFREMVIILNEATMLSGIKELWWDVRPHPDFGTLEVRICDMPSRFDEILAVVALIQALVCHLAGSGEPLPPFREVILNNKWHASRYGLDGTFIAPSRGRHTTMATAAMELVERLTPVAAELGSVRYLAPIKRIVAQGNSAKRQRMLYAGSGDLAGTIAVLREEFWA